MSDRPSVAPPKAWSFPSPSRTKMPNGLDVLAYPMPGQHVVSVGLSLDLPVTEEPRAKEGAVAILARCLDEGTSKHPGGEFAEALENLGAVFGAHAGSSATTCYVDVPASRLEPALSLFAEAIIDPALERADVHRHRGLRLAEIAQHRAHPAQRVGMEFRRAVIAADDRTSRSTAGEADTVANIAADDVAALHRRWYQPGGSLLVLAGDFATDPMAAAAAAFNAWSPSELPTPAHHRTLPGRPTVVLVDRPGSVQADVRLGGFGIDRTDPRWAAFQVAGHAMGGGFLSRLNRLLREERGYTYGVRFAAHPYRSGGMFAVQGSFRGDSALPAIVEARDLLAGEPFTPAEVGEAIDFLVGVTPLRFASASGVMEQVLALRAVGMGPERVDAHLAAVRAVTPEAATEAFAGIVRPEDLSLAIVGDAETLAEPLRAEGFDVQVKALAD